MWQPSSWTILYNWCHSRIYNVSCGEGPSESPTLGSPASTNEALLLLAAAKSLQLCPTLCDPIDGSPPGFPIPGILQARTLEWVAISFSNCMKVKSEREVTQSCLTLTTPWTAAYQAPPSMGFSRQKYWSGMPLPSPNGALMGALVPPGLSAAEIWSPF